MSLLQKMYGVMGGSGIIFAPTIIGQISADGRVVEALAGDSSSGPSSSSANTSIWLETTASECFLRVDGSANGNSFSSVTWYSPVDVSEGTPGTDENIFLLGERPDTVNIYTAALTDSEPDVDQVAIGSFTDDDKITFFNPTNGVNYGYELQVAAVDPGDKNQLGRMTLKFTFRKAGFIDLSVLFRSRGIAEADDFS